jgi:hypothetical protein
MGFPIRRRPMRTAIIHKMQHIHILLCHHQLIKESSMAQLTSLMPQVDVILLITTGKD